ncbi:MAG: hypothetical protein KC544_08065 [Gemmatimonadetes bacterium]|nr:hypothetical protein [Gemmatimonadota bacterium]MCA9769143.1 hypothetical protein [Gemmatimonadota bacterium]MCB9519205.1 hypothetical protein [Gemmatimonadales bacterium]
MPTVLSMTSSALGRRDEMPNVLLAERIAATADRTAVTALLVGLASSERAISYDCIKVLYEVGERAPHLVAEHAKTFVSLLDREENRLVWGGMTALNAIAMETPAELFRARARIMSAIRRGSVITQDTGVQALARMAGTSVAYRRAVLPFLLEHLATCRSKDVPQRAERIQPAVDRAHLDAFLGVLAQRAHGASPAGQRRIRAVLRKLPPRG